MKAELLASDVSGTLLIDTTADGTLRVSQKKGMSPAEAFA